MTSLLFAALLPAASAAAPPPRPDGEPAGGGTQKLAAQATSHAHYRFSGDACLAKVDVLAGRKAGDGVREDVFEFLFRSPSLTKMAFRVKVCFPQDARVTASPACSGEWSFEQFKTEEAVLCLPKRPADSAEALLAASRQGLAKSGAEGRRMSLRAIGKGDPLAPAKGKARLEAAWILQNGAACRALDAKTLAVVRKGSCSALRAW